MKDPNDKKKLNDAVDNLLKELGSKETMETIKQRMQEKLPCGHTREEHAAATFLAMLANKAGMAPKLLLAAAKALVESEDQLLQLQIEWDLDEATSEPGSVMTSTDGTPVVMSPMPKEMQ